MAKTSIEWSDNVWNPVSGCTRVSAGCDNCYAVTMTKRLEAMGKPKYAGLVNIGKGHFNGTVKCHEDALLIPLKAKKPRRWFVNSMSDLFHREVPFEFIDKVFAVMALCPHHTFQILTKRPERMAEYLQPGWTDRVVPLLDQLKPSNLWNGNVYQAKYNLALLPVPGIWLGTSVEDQATADERIPHLLRCPAAVRFLSCEPLLSAVDLCKTDAMGDRCACTGMLDYKPILDGYGCSDCQNHGVTSPPHIHWCIVGGESGPGARPMHPDWARSLRDQCVAAGVPFFFKQVGEWDCYEPSNPLFQSAFSHHSFDPAGFPDWEDEDEKYADRWFPDVSDGVVHHRVGKRSAGRLLDGRTWDEFPEVDRGK